MKERAIDIFEKRKEKKKGRGVERTLTGATGGSRLCGFNLRQHAYHISNEKQRKKGINHWYHLLVCTTDGTPESRYQM